MKRASIKNFRCFRQEISAELGNSNYLIGTNNSGKTAFLSAIHCFFDSSLYTPTYLNKSEFSRRQEGYNKSEITLSFDLEPVVGEARRRRMTTEYGDEISIKKTFTFREISETLQIEYSVGDGAPDSFESLNEDVKALLRAASISYIHPQEGNDLLKKAQEKFKQRLFHNWGRHVSVADKLKDLSEQWDELRQLANSYLSSSLTNSIQAIWPNSETKVDLPERIEDIVAISDISFKSNSALPEVTLTSQGTGVQSIVLYQTHYILDSDRSLHQGMYFPIWLLEEPESFLHADIAVQLGNLLNSSEWLNEIQMVISTHSPIILAASRRNADRTRWIIFEDHAIKEQKDVTDITTEDLSSIGQMMGDQNFEAYFAASSADNLIFSEDQRPLTIAKLEEAGIPIERGLDGISTVKKFISVFETLPQIVRGQVSFLVDNDQGANELKKYLKDEEVELEIEGFKRINVTEKIKIILFPEGMNAESLFEEYSTVLDDSCQRIFDENFKIRDQIPTELSRAVGQLRRKSPPSSLTEAKTAILNFQDVKDIFWRKVEDENYQIKSTYANALKQLTAPGNRN